MSLSGSTCETAGGRFVRRRQSGLALLPAGLPPQRLTNDPVGKPDRAVPGCRCTAAARLQDNALVPDGYSLLCYLLRDVRAERVAPMDLKLIHLLFGIQAWMRACGIRQPLRVNSGYRTPETHANTEGAAAHSRYLAGPTADFRGGGNSERGIGEARCTVQRWRGGRVSDVRACGYRTG